MTVRRRLVELSHIIHDGMITYPGLPGPSIGDHLSHVASREHYAPGTEFHIGHISLVGNTGTYLDAPAHRFADADDLSMVTLDRLVDLEGLLVTVPPDVRAVEPSLLEPYDVTGRAVLIHTGWDRHWGTAEYGGGGHPYLAEASAQWLAGYGAVLVGIDSLNVDSTGGRTRPAHTVLLRHGIAIVEHLCSLDALPRDGFRFHAAPPRIAGMDTFPVRAYAVVEDVRPAV